MQPLAIGTATAFIVAPRASVLSLILGLAGPIINDNVVDLHIGVAVIVIGERHVDVAVQVGNDTVIHHGRVQRPALHINAVYPQGNRLRAGSAECAHRNIVNTTGVGARE